MRYRGHSIGVVMTKKLSELSKDELLSLIYNQLPKTRFGDHRCECINCSEEILGQEDSYWYECDECKELNEKWIKDHS